MNTLQISINGQVARLSLHRPQAHNALDAALTAQLQAQVTTWTQALSQASPDGLAACKQLIARACGQPINADLIAHTVQVLANRRASAQGREGVAAFLQKRKPGWAV